MANTFLTYVNDTLVRLNEVELTASTFSDSRGVQTQAKNAVNQAIRYINQREYNYPFNHATATQTLTAGTVKYSVPTSTKVVDYNTFRLVKDSDLGNGSISLSPLNYNEYLNSYVEQEDEIQTTTLSQSHTDSVTTLTVASTTGFGSSVQPIAGSISGTASSTGSSLRVANSFANVQGIASISVLTILIQGAFGNLAGIATVRASSSAFNYTAQRDNYARPRTVYIERRTTSADRTNIVSVDARKISIERSLTTFDRTVKVAA